ncbi:hypothetical protein SAMN04489740_4008 [Arthrobacter alpinus]|uniref:Uncharacterized protein n=1 Tax=Arthrobacter alpinus TaxID=656366 RepID=A0A1H5PBZ4_9MICC|nr:hypothetical protein [Arthrobacter alpinus]SEF10591.1 hypothetical protein SAMN04489740_4008 [Arthrobacter alpinus]
MEVWELAASDKYAIASEVFGNTSLMNDSEKFASAIRSQWDMEGVIEHWLDGFRGETFVQGAEVEGHGSLDFADFKRRGLVFL